LSFWAVAKNLKFITYDITMNNPEIKEQAEEKLENLGNLGKIRDETWSYIFEWIYFDEEKLKEFLKKFSDIYYLSVNPFEIEKYKDNPAIYEILKRYEHWAEYRKLEVMLFKLKEISEEEKQKILEKLRKEFEWMNIKLDDTKYVYIVWYFWWTSWRTNSAYMEEIKKIYPV